VLGAVIGVEERGSMRRRPTGRGREGSLGDLGRAGGEEEGEGAGRREESLEKSEEKEFGSCKYGVGCGNYVFRDCCHRTLTTESRVCWRSSRLLSARIPGSDGLGPAGVV